MANETITYVQGLPRRVLPGVFLEFTVDTKPLRDFIANEIFPGVFQDDPELFDPTPLRWPLRFDSAAATKLVEFVAASYGVVITPEDIWWAVTGLKLAGTIEGRLNKKSS